MAEASLIDRVLEEQADSWKGKPGVPAEELLRRHPELGTDGDSAVDVVYNEFLLREAAGETPDPAEFIRRFPKFADQLRLQFEIHSSPESGVTAATQSGGVAVAPAPPGVEALPDVPGYELLDVLGRGGMGVVFRARQTGLGRIVAVKMILAGSVAGERERARFRTEAESAARLAHPNIVQIHEIGEAEGHPFLSLEFVAGGTLAGRLKGKPEPIEQITPLIETLARAVHYAHQRGVVHRDLKPANILITAEGVPKITDFGLAKQLDSQAGMTESGAVLGTPSYMAPEQAGGRGEVGPAADVHALGAVLYEMLTGRPPFLGGTALETVLLVVGQEPVPPSRLRPKMPVDLETICLKCLQKEPARRYGSAEALAEDLRRFRAGEPILARPVGRVERAIKWVRRRPAAAGLAVVSAAAIVGTIIGLWRYNADLQAAAEKEARQRRRADAGLQMALDAADRMLDQVADRLTPVPHTEQIRRELLERALQLYSAFLKEAGATPEARRRTAHAHWRTGDIHRYLARREEAEKAYTAAIEEFEALAAEFPDDVDIRRALAGTQINSADLLSDLQRTQDAERNLARARALLEPLAAAHKDRPELRRDLGIACDNHGIRLRTLKRMDESDAAYRRAAAVREQLAAEFPSNPIYRVDLAFTLLNHGVLMQGLGKSAESIAAFERADAILGDADLIRQVGWDLEFRQISGAAANNLAAQRQEAGRLPEAAELFAKACRHYGGLASDFPTIAQYRLRYADAELNLALLLSRQMKKEDAVAAARRSVDVFTRLSEDFPKLPECRRGLAGARLALGSMLRDTGNDAEAEKSYRQAAELREKLADESPKDASLQDSAGIALNNLAIQLLGSDKAAAAVPIAARATERFRTARRLLAGDKVAGMKLRMSLSMTADLQLMTNKPADAAKTAEAMMKELAEDPEAAFDAASCLARCPPPPDRSAAVLEALRAAVARGFADKARLRSTPELAPIRRLPAYAEIEAKIGKSQVPANPGANWWDRQFRR